MSKGKHSLRDNAVSYTTHCSTPGMKVVECEFDEHNEEKQLKDPTMPYTVHVDLCVACVCACVCVCAHMYVRMFVHVCVRAERNRRFYGIGEMGTEFLATKVLGELATDEILVMA